MSASHADSTPLLWHSSAHVLGWALELRFPDQIDLCDGPPVSNGFFYEFAWRTTPTEQQHHQGLVPEQLAEVESLAKALLDVGTHKFERMEVSKEVALDMFRDNHLKRELITDILNQSQQQQQQQQQQQLPILSVYRTGNFVDLCRGPHIPSTRFIRSLLVTKSSAAYWKGDSTRESLQRVYGVSFKSVDEMKQWQMQQELAQKRDHRLIGRNQELFFFDPLSPGEMGNGKKDRDADLKYIHCNCFSFSISFNQ
jgi:threonyl-tRNA synthetase